MSGCLKLVGKMPVVKEMLTMVVLIGGMVDATYFRGKMEYNPGQIAYVERYEEFWKYHQCLQEEKNESSII